MSQMSEIKMNRNVTIGYKMVVMFTLCPGQANVNMSASE